MNRGNLAYVVSALGLVAACASGCSKNEAAASTTSAASPSTDVAAKPGVVNVIADEKGFTPSSVEVKKGTATTLVFQRTTDETCAKQVVFPELKITKELPLNEKVSFEIPVADARTLTFQCGMGMFKGKIVVL